MVPTTKSAVRTGSNAGDATTATTDSALSDADVYVDTLDVDDVDNDYPTQAPQAPQHTRLPPIALARPVSTESATRGLTAAPSGRGMRFLLVHTSSINASTHTVPLPPPSAIAVPSAPPLVVVLSRAQVDAVEQYRWVAFFLFLLYVLTFFAWPSYIMSVCGLVTGLIGYGSCRMSQQGSRRNLSLVALFIAANYVMLVFLAWVFLSFFVHDLQPQPAPGSMATVLLGAFVALSVFLHARAQRIARDFLVAFRVGVAFLPQRRRGSLTVVRNPRIPVRTITTAATTTRVVHHDVAATAPLSVAYAA